MPPRCESAESLVVILIGAKQFPYSKNLCSNDAFARSVDAVRSYLQDHLRIRPNKILNLFNDPSTIIDQDQCISRFLNKNRLARNILVYYVGHGGFLSDREYYLVIRSTRQHKEHITGFRIKALATTLAHFTDQKNLFIILDCCFAGEAVKEFQSKELTEVIKTKTFEVLPGTGTALLVAASKDEPAMSPAKNPYTMFSDSFLKVLREGVPDGPPMLSLRDVAIQTWNLIKTKYGQASVHPEIHSPRQKGIDVADIPIFPNSAATGDSAQSSGGWLEIRGNHGRSAFVKNVQQQVVLGSIEKWKHNWAECFRKHAGSYIMYSCVLTGKEQLVAMSLLRIKKQSIHGLSFDVFNVDDRYNQTNPTIYRYEGLMFPIYECLVFYAEEESQNEPLSMITSSSQVRTPSILTGFLLAVGVTPEIRRPTGTRIVVSFQNRKLIDLKDQIKKFGVAARTR